MLSSLTPKTIHTIFHSCCQWLNDYAAQVGSTYEEVNVVLFCIIVPICFAILVATNVATFGLLISKKPLKSWKTVIVGVLFIIMLMITVPLASVFLSAMSYIQ